MRPDLRADAPPLVPDLSAVELRIDGRHAYVTLNRPGALNALNLEVLDELEMALDVIESWKECSVLILSANGRSFCAGTDLRMLNDFKGQSGIALSFVDSVRRLFDRIECFPIPVIAAVNGLALAGGLELVLCCDIVVASETATFGDCHAKYGLFPGGGASARLPRKIGVARASYLMLSAATVSARTMQDWGLVARIAPADDLAAAVDELARMLSERSPDGLARMKATLRDGMDRPLSEALQLEREAFAAHARSSDFTEGLAAFDQKRTPYFAVRSSDSDVGEHRR